MSLQDQSENLEAIKSLCPEYKKELKEKALKMIWKQDQEQEEGRSDDLMSVDAGWMADIMIKFYLELTNEKR